MKKKNVYILTQREYLDRVQFTLQLLCWARVIVKNELGRGLEALVHQTYLMYLHVALFRTSSKDNATRILESRFRKYFNNLHLYQLRTPTVQADKVQHGLVFRTSNSLRRISLFSKDTFTVSRLQLNKLVSREFSQQKVLRMPSPSQRTRNIRQLFIYGLTYKEVDVQLQTYCKRKSRRLRLDVEQQSPVSTNT